MAFEPGVPTLVGRSPYAGPPFTIDIFKAGFLRVQRQANPRVHNYAVVEDVILTVPYLAAEKFVPGAATGKLVRGSTTPVNKDKDPARRATLYFPPATRTTNFAVADGALLDVQVTEYTVADRAGRAGRAQAHARALPPTSGYTYAVEVGFPAAAAAGVQDVRFDKNVVLYVTNFTGYPGRNHRPARLLRPREGSLARGQIGPDHQGPFRAGWWSGDD